MAFLLRKIYLEEFLEINTMKRAIICLAMIISGTCISTAQERDCANAKLYNLVFKEMKLYERKAVEIKIGYEPTKFIINSINEMNIFNTKEMDQFNNLPENTDYLSCAKFKRQIELILDDDLIKANGSFTCYKFSKVISISNSKKCLLSYSVSKNIKYEGGKAMGDEVLYIFNRNGNKWMLSDKKSIAMY